MIKNKISVSMALVFVFFLLSACAAVEYQTPVLEGPSRIINKHYEINKPYKVYAGERMIEKKDYWAFTTTHQKMKALNNFKIEGPGVNYSGSKGDAYNIILTTDLNTLPYYFIEIPGVFRRYGINQEGEWQNSYFYEGHALKARTPITPKDTTFEHIVETKINKVAPSKPFTHFEIIFTGKTPDAINFEYREYAPDDPGRTGPPESQKKLSFPADTKIFQHNQTFIKIHEVTNESISYSVLPDSGMADEPDWNFILLTDSSISMTPEYQNMKISRMGVALKLMRDINREIPKIHANFGVYTFEAAKAVQPLAPFDREAASQAINAMPTDSGFAGRPAGIGSGLLNVDASLGGREGNIAFIILTGGGDSDIGPKPDAVMTELYQKYYDRICFHFINLGTKPKERKFVDSLAGINPCSIVIDAEEVMDYNVRAKFIEEIFSPAKITEISQ